MNLKYDNNLKLIQVLNSDILAAINSPSSYNTITVNSKLLEGTYTTINGKTNTTYYTTVLGSRYLNSSIVGQSGEFTVNGVYEITFIISNTSGTRTIKSCILVDNNLQCSFTQDKDFLKHYILKQTQHCTCDCVKLNNIYKSLAIQNNLCNECY
jgi:hypothetical protein